jgi:hypothetical protein
VRCVAVDGDARSAKGIVARAAAHERCDRDGEVGDGRGVAGVAEVDDPGDVSVVVEEHVAEVHVAVHHLSRQCVPERRDVLRVTVEHRLDEPAPVAEVPEMLAQLRRVLEIPEQLAARSRVEEPAQRPGQARMGDAVRPDGGVREVRPAVPAGHALEQPDDVPLVRRSLQLSRDRQLGIGVQRVLDRRRLELEVRRILSRVRDLDHPGALDEEGLVALAAEVAGVPADAEQVGGERRDVVGCEPRRRRFENGGHQWCSWMTFPPSTTSVAPVT